MTSKNEHKIISKKKIAMLVILCIVVLAAAITMPEWVQVYREHRILKNTGYYEMEEAVEANYKKSLAKCKFNVLPLMQQVRAKYLIAKMDLATLKEASLEEFTEYERGRK